ncbi:UNVERIFIED_CONTAM: hypothetical protein K2H54_037620 [Gekko kuhli]
MARCQVTFEVRGESPPGVVFAICGSCKSLGNWDPQCAVILQPEDEAGDVLLWKATIDLPRGDDIEYRYFQGTFLQPQVLCIVHTKYRVMQRLQWYCIFPKAIPLTFSGHLTCCLNAMAQLSTKTYYIWLPGGFG